MITPIPGKALARLQAAIDAVQHAQELLNAQTAAVADTLGLDTGAAGFTLDMQQGGFVTPDQADR